MVEKKQALFFVITILILLAIGAYSIFSLLFPDFFNNKKNLTLREQAIEEDVQRPEKTINLKHQYKNGTHTFMGVIEVPTPCYEVRAVILPGETPELQINTKALQTFATCDDVITELSYKVSYEGPEDITFLATVNNIPVNLNQFEIPPDQDIDSVEIFIKG